MLTLTRFFPELRLDLLRDRIARIEAVRLQRAALRELPPHLLEDVGLTPDAARAEAARPAWDVDYRL